MENNQKSIPVAILSNGEQSYSLFDGITVIGHEWNGRGQHIKLSDDEIESRHAAVRIKHNSDGMEAEIMDLFTSIGTKIEGESIPFGQWISLQSDNWITFGAITLKFTFVPIDDQSEVISRSPEPIPVRRRCRSMVPTQTTPLEAIEKGNISKRASLLLAENSQAVHQVIPIAESRVAKVDYDETDEDDEEVIPETQQSSAETDLAEVEDDSEFVFVESESQSKLNFHNPEAMESQICPIVDESYHSDVGRDESRNNIIIEGSADGSLHLQLDVTPSQKEKNKDEIPDIFKDTEEVPEDHEEGVDIRDDTVTPDLDEIEQAEDDAKSVGAPLTSLASTESKTTVETAEMNEHHNELTDDGSSLESVQEPDDIYNAETQPFNGMIDVNQTIVHQSVDNSDDDIFFAPTQMVPAPVKKLIPKREPETPSNESPNNIYEIATQRLNLSSHTDEPQPSTSTRDDNIYDALTQVLPREYLQIPPTPTPKIADPRPPYQVDSDESDTDFTTAPTMIATSQSSVHEKPDPTLNKTPKEPQPGPSSSYPATPTPEESCFFDSFSQLNTPDIFNVKLPLPIKVKDEESSSPNRDTIKQGNRLDASSLGSPPQASSTVVKRKAFEVQKSKLQKSSPIADLGFAHFNDSPSKTDVFDVNTPEFLNLPSKDELEKQTQTLDSKKNSGDGTYFFEDPSNLTDTQIVDPDTSEQDSHTRTRANHKQSVNKTEPPKKPLRRFPKPKPPTSMPPPLSSPLSLPSPQAQMSPINEPRKRSLSTDSGPSTSREPSGRKRTKPTKLTEYYVTESQMDDYHMGPSKRKNSTGRKASPLQEKNDALEVPSKDTANEKQSMKPVTRQLKVVVKPVAAVATALPETISPEIIGPRKRKATRILNSESEDEDPPAKPEAQGSPTKLRRIKTDVSSDGGSSSNEPLAALKRTLTGTSRTKRGARNPSSTIDVLGKTIKTRSRDAPKQKILFTMVNSALYVEKIKKTGHFLATSINDATVLVTDKVYRSPKLLSAIARGLPIVSVSWFDAFDQKLDPNIEKYLIHDSDSENKYHFSLRGSMEDIQRNGPVLKDYLVICSPSTKPHPNEIKQIVESSLGQFSDKISDLSNKKGDKYLVVAHQDDQKFIKAAKKKDAKVKIINSEAFMLTIMKNELIDDKKYLL